VENHLLNIDQAQIWIQIFCYLYSPPFSVKHKAYLGRQQIPPIDTTLLSGMSSPWDTGHHRFCGFVVGRATPPDAIRDVLFLLPVDLPPPVIGNAFSLGHRASSLCCSFVVGRATPPDAIRDVLFLLPVNFPSSCEFPVWSFCPEGQLYGDFYLLG